MSGTIRTTKENSRPALQLPLQLQHHQGATLEEGAGVQPLGMTKNYSRYANGSGNAFLGGTGGGM
jgi:hypothetical protein